MADRIEDNKLLSADSTAINTNGSSDNLQFTNTITPDSLPDNDQTIPDSSPDNTVGDSQSSDNLSRIPISDFLKKYNNKDNQSSTNATTVSSKALDTAGNAVDTTSVETLPLFRTLAIKLGQPSSFR